MFLHLPAAQHGLVKGQVLELDIRDLVEGDEADQIAPVTVTKEGSVGGLHTGWGLHMGVSIGGGYPHRVAPPMSCGCSSASSIASKTAWWRVHL